MGAAVAVEGGASYIWEARRRERRLETLGKRLIKFGGILSVGRGAGRGHIAAGRAESEGWSGPRRAVGGAWRGARRARRGAYNPSGTQARRCCLPASQGGARAAPGVDVHRGAAGRAAPARAGQHRRPARRRTPSIDAPDRLEAFELHQASLRPRVTREGGPVNGSCGAEMADRPRPAGRDQRPAPTADASPKRMTSHQQARCLRAGPPRRRLAAAGPRPSPPSGPPASLPPCPPPAASPPAPPRPEAVHSPTSFIITGGREGRFLLGAWGPREHSTWGRAAARPGGSGGPMAARRARRPRGAGAGTKKQAGPPSLGGEPWRGGIVVGARSIGAVARAVTPTRALPRPRRRLGNGGAAGARQRL
jgi:hypothetical protein